jgi:hypothetical protein
VGDLAIGVGPDLRARGLVMALGTGWVGVLVRFPGTFGLAYEAIGNVVIAVRMVRRDGGGADDDVGAVSPHGVALVLADLVGAHEDATIVSLLCN